MAKTRLQLHTLLSNICENCYYSPPSVLSYPCIVYALDGAMSYHADDVKYVGAKRYTVTLIDEDPDTEMVDELLALRYCSFDRSFKSDNLNHFVFTLYF